jgi:hypothetical protein
MTGVFRFRDYGLKEGAKRPGLSVVAIKLKY